VNAAVPTPAAPAIDLGHGVMLDGAAPVFILGPCAIETPELAREVAGTVTEIATRLGLRLVFKASYDKANRTSLASFRGPGPEEGARLLAQIGAELGVPVTTDVHTPEHIDLVAPHVDVLQIPAFLCRQTDLVVAAAKSGRVVNVKKGQFLAPWDLAPIAEKIVEAGNENFFFTERGSSFGYNNLVADMRSLAWIRKQGFRVVFDATHSVQRPGGLGGATGGDREMAPVLARSAVAAGCDGIFMETHPRPDEALSDGPNMVALNEIEGHLSTLQALHAVVAGPAAASS